MKTIFKHTLLSLALLAGAFNAQAQVKIGTSPTTIDPNNNLEVQGSIAGRKFTVDKVSGKVTIADGTEGSGKVLTSDSVGGASWQNAPATGPGIVEAVNEGTAVCLSSTVGNRYTSASITFPKAGTYLVYARLSVTSGSGSSGSGYFGVNLSTSSTSNLYSLLLTGYSTEQTGIYNVGTGYFYSPCRVVVSAGETLYFWIVGSNFPSASACLRLDEAYATGPFL